MIFYVDEKCKMIVNFCAISISETKIEIYDYNQKTIPDPNAIYAHLCYYGYVVETYDERFHYKKSVFKKTDDFLYYIIDAISFVVALDYAKNTHDESKEYREILFEKELEIFSRFDKPIFERKQAEIKKCLENVGD